MRRFSITSVAHVFNTGDQATSQLTRDVDQAREHWQDDENERDQSRSPGCHRVHVIGSYAEQSPTNLKDTRVLGNLNCVIRYFSGNKDSSVS